MKTIRCTALFATIFSLQTCKKNEDGDSKKSPPTSTSTAISTPGTISEITPSATPESEVITKKIEGIDSAREVQFVISNGFAPCPTLKKYALSELNLSLSQTDNRCPENNKTKSVQLEQIRKDQIVQMIKNMELKKMSFPCPADAESYVLILKSVNEEKKFESMSCNINDFVFKDSDFNSIL